MAGESAEQVARRQRERAARLERSAEMWERGAQGERATGAILDGLRAEGWAVFHDVRWPDRVRANIDHVAIGPSGVFVIDSKNWAGRIDIREGTFTCRGRRHDRTIASAGDAALAVARHVSAPAAGLVHAVLCFVRDERIEGRCHEVLMCSTANLREMLVSRPAVLTPDQVRMAALELGVFLRAATASSPRPSPAPPRRQVASRPSVPSPQPRRQQPKKSMTGRFVGLGLIVLVALLGLSQLPLIVDLATQVVSDVLVGHQYGTCGELREDYPNGVGRAAAVDEMKRQRHRPAVDERVFIANSSLDRDDDGLICERPR